MSEKNKRDQAVYSYLSEQEKKDLEAQAEKEYRPVSVLIRIAIAEYMQRNSAKKEDK